MMELPAVGPLSVSPASTNMLLGLGGFGMRPPSVAVAHSGAGTGLPDNALRGATKPPPNSLTFVKVCVSPARFSKLRTVPGARVPAAGSKCHEPTFWAAVSCAIKFANVISPLPTHVPGPTAALNVAGSQGPWIRIANGFSVAKRTTAATNGIIAIATLPHSFHVTMSLPSLQPEFPLSTSSSRKTDTPAAASCQPPIWANPSEPAAQLSAHAGWQTTVSSDDPPPRATNNSGHVSPAVLWSSLAPAASWSRTNRRPSWPAPAATTNSPSFRPAGSAPAAPRSTGTDGNSAGTSSPPA